MKNKGWILYAVMALLQSAPSLAQWQEGNFSGELSWQGTVTHTRNPWSWYQGNVLSGLSLSLADAHIEGTALAWRDVLPQMALLLGKTEDLLPVGQAGIEPIIRYGGNIPGFNLQWKEDGIAVITLLVRGYQDGKVLPGTLSFSLQVSAGITAVQRGIRQIFSVTAAGADVTENGLPLQGNAMSAAKALDVLRVLFGQDAPRWLWQSVADSGYSTFSEIASMQRQGIGAIYGAQIIYGSGTLIFPDGQVPTRWQASLPVQISYR